MKNVSIGWLREEETPDKILLHITSINIKSYSYKYLSLNHIHILQVLQTNLSPTIVFVIVVNR
jgi:hypothetical protein